MRKYDLPTLEGWMLKRGDAFAVGMMNSWRVRYFRQEKGELVYYSKLPDRRPAEDSVVSVDRPEGSGLAAAAPAEDGGPTIPKEKITDDNLKGSINLSEVVACLCRAHRLQ